MPLSFAGPVAGGEGREFQSEDGAARGRFRPDRSPVSPNNLAGNGQAESGALAGRLGGEERTEDQLPVRFGNPGAVVLDSQDDPLRAVRSERDPDRAVAAMRADGLLGVDDQVEQHLLQLVAVAPYPAPERVPLVRVEVWSLQRDVVELEMVPAQRHRAAHHVGDRADAPLGRILPSRGKQAVDNFAGPAGLLEDQLEVLSQLSERHALTHELGGRVPALPASGGNTRTGAGPDGEDGLGARDDRREGVAQFMSDAC